MWVWMIIEPCRAFSQNFTDLTKYGPHVYVFVRGSCGELRAFKIMAKRLLSNLKFVYVYSCFWSANTTKNLYETVTVGCNDHTITWIIPLREGRKSVL